LGIIGNIAFEEHDAVAAAEQRPASPRRSVACPFPQDELVDNPNATIFNATLV
jgi:hypothetical protein